MKYKNLILVYLIIPVFLFCSCSDEPNNSIASPDGVKISFDVLGEGSPAIVFIHGWSNNRTIWDAQVSHFSKKYMVIAVDLPGFGESGNNRTNWTISSFGEDIVTLINKLDREKVVLVGFSMGAPIAIEAANRLPNRISGIVLVDDLHDVEMKIPLEAFSYLDSVYMDLVTNPTNEKLVAGGFYKKNPEISYKRVLSMLKDTSRIGWRESLNATLRWQNEDCIESLKKVNVPVNSINSDRLPTNLEAFRKYVPSYEAKIIPATGHVVMWDATDEFNRLLEESIHEFKVN